MKVVIPAHLPPNWLRTMADGTLRLYVDTPELPPEAFSVLTGLRNTASWVSFATSESEASEVPPEDVPEFKTDKSPSQRLRAVLYRYYEQRPELHSAHPTFNRYYEYVLETKINEIKEKLV